MNKENHTHQSYISNPFKAVESAAKGLFANVGMAAAHIGISLAVVFGFMLVFGLSFIPVFIGGEDLVFIPIIAAVILALPLTYAFSWLNLVAKRLAIASSEHKTIAFGEMFKHDAKKVFGLIGLSILVGLAVFGGLILLIIPGILLGIFFSYAPFIYVREKDTGVIDAMGKSFELVKDSFAELLGVGSVFFAYRSVSALLANIPFIGLLFSIVLIPIDMFVAYLTDVTNAYRYISIDQVKSHGLARPKVDSTNYIMIAVVAGLIVISVLLMIGFIAFLIANPEFLDESSSY